RHARGGRSPSSTFRDDASWLTLLSPGFSAPAGVRARAPCLARWIRSAHGDRLGQHHGHQPPAPAALQLVELRARGALRLGLADAPEALLELRVAEVAGHLRLGDQPIDVLAHLLQ